MWLTTRMMFGRAGTSHLLTMLYGGHCLRHNETDHGLMASFRRREGRNKLCVLRRIHLTLLKTPLVETAIVGSSVPAHAVMCTQSEFKTSAEGVHRIKLIDAKGYFLTTAQLRPNCPRSAWAKAMLLHADAAQRFRRFSKSPESNAQVPATVHTCRVHVIVTQRICIGAKHGILLIRS